MLLSNFCSVGGDTTKLLAMLAKRRGDHFYPLLGETLANKTDRTKKVGVVGNEKGLIEAVFVGVTYQVSRNVDIRLLFFVSVTCTPCNKFLCP